MVEYLPLFLKQKELTLPDNFDAEYTLTLIKLRFFSFSNFKHKNGRKDNLISVSYWIQIPKE